MLLFSYFDASLFTSLIQDSEQVAKATKRLRMLQAVPGSNPHLQRCTKRL